MYLHLIRHPKTILADNKKAREQRRLERAVRKNGHATLLEVAHPPYHDDPSLNSIGEKLREVYQDVIAEPVPSRFVTLLHNLEAAAA